LRCLIQRVNQASVSVSGENIGAISKGLLVLVGFGPGDTTQTLEKMARKLIQMRLFPDEQGKMNLSLLDIHGSLLLVSQFTLYADTRKGHRPSFTQAAAPSEAEAWMASFVDICRRMNAGRVATGAFGAHMKVMLENDGPVTLFLEMD
jgi:D-tyrosyl-tRNA(Tyr) deacylase